MRRVLYATTICLVTAFAAGGAGRVGAQGGGAGTIEGHVRLTGAAPANPMIRMGRDPICASLNAGKRPLQEIVTRAQDGGLANAFVELDGAFPATPVPTEVVAINQRDCVYTPRVVGARVGQTLRLINSDTLLHNLHAISAKGNDFNETQPHSDMVFNYTLKSEERMLRVKCDVHSWMTAYVAVVTHPYFAVTSQDGAFRIGNVPAGRYTLKSWQERYGWIMQTVEVKPGATATVDFSYTGAERPVATTLHELRIPLI
jgi:plastocyanin